MESIVSTHSGTGSQGADDGLTSTSTFYSPYGICVDENDDLIVSQAHCIRRITRDGVVTTISGSLKNGSQDGSLNMASFYNPCGICLDQNGDIIVADTYNHKIRRLSLKNSIVSTICGTGKSGFKDGDSMTALLNESI